MNGTTDLTGYTPEAIGKAVHFIEARLGELQYRHWDAAASQERAARAVQLRDELSQMFWYQEDEVQKLLSKLMAERIRL